MDRRASFDHLPLFATDAEIGAALLGKRAGEWVGIAALLERRGLPRVDPLLGGRYVPAVRRFFDVDNGIDGNRLPTAPDGVEDLGAWKRNLRRPG